MKFSLLMNLGAWRVSYFSIVCFHIPSKIWLNLVKQEKSENDVKTEQKKVNGPATDARHLKPVQVTGRQIFQDDGNLIFFQVRIF